MFTKTWKSSPSTLPSIVATGYPFKYLFGQIPTVLTLSRFIVFAEIHWLYPSPLLQGRCIHGALPWELWALCERWWRRKAACRDRKIHRAQRWLVATVGWSKDHWLLVLSPVLIMSPPVQSESFVSPTSSSRALLKKKSNNAIYIVMVWSHFMLGSNNYDEWRL